MFKLYEFISNTKVKTLNVTDDSKLTFRKNSLDFTSHIYLTEIIIIVINTTNNDI